MEYFEALGWNGKRAYFQHNRDFATVLSFVRSMTNYQWKIIKHPDGVVISQSLETGDLHTFLQTEMADPTHGIAQKVAEMGEAISYESVILSDEELTQEDLSQIEQLVQRFGANPSF